MTETPQSVRNLVETALATYDVSLSGQLDAVETSDGVYEVEAAFEGELILEEVMSNQGLLLYNKRNQGELSLKGLRDGRLLLTAKPALE
jgi:hypothetical protein